MVADSPVNLGIIGCGLAANELHWPALRSLKDRFIVRAVCNHTPEKARRFAVAVGTEYGTKIPFVTDYRELVQRQDITAVSILLPIELNVEVSTAATSAGKHVLLEKPLAADRRSGAQLLELERAHPELTMMVAEHFRYRAEFVALREAVLSGRIGIPHSVECVNWEHIDPATNPYAQTQWRINHVYEGGFVTDAGIHYIAALRDLVGDLDILASVTQQTNPSIGRMDSLLALFHSSGRAGIPPMSGVLDLDYSAPGARTGRLGVRGAEGRVVLEGSILTAYGPTPDSKEIIPISSKDEGYAAEYEDFHRAITTGGRPVSTLEQAYADLDTMLTAIEVGSR